MSTRLQNKIYSYFEKFPQLRVLFIFSDPFLREDLLNINWKEGYKYIEFQNNWFTLKYKLENDWANLKVILYFDQPSPLTNISLMENFPLIDLLIANEEFKNSDYEAYMQEFNLPSSLADFVKENIKQLQTEKLRKLLVPYYTDRNITLDIAVRALLSSYLNQQKVLDWEEIIISLFILDKNEKKEKDHFYNNLHKTRIAKEQLNRKLTQIFGETYSENDVKKMVKIAQKFKYSAITQQLAPVDADIYKNLKITNTESLEKINCILERATSQKHNASAFLEALEELGSEIRYDNLILWYGTDANYSFIPEELNFLIVKKLIEEDLTQDPPKVVKRLEELKNKLNTNEELQTCISYAILVAKYYKYKPNNYIENTPNNYIERYIKEYYLIDQIYRMATEAYYKISPNTRLFESIRNTKKLLDNNYAKFVHQLNLEWSKCISQNKGYASISILRQQDFYNHYIKSAQNKTVVIISDALRYELANNLVSELHQTRNIATLDCALAMLPTETKYCKPSLLPHKSLTLTFGQEEIDMSVDNKTLGSTTKRSEHLASYKEKAICVNFKDIARYNTEENKEIFKHPLVYIFHDNIDTQGHNGNAKEIVSYCTEAIKDLTKMINNIHSTHNITKIYVTADHGFLFNDKIFEDRDKIEITEDTLEKKSRYYLTKSNAPASNITKFNLADVSAINAPNLYVGIPEGTNRLLVPSGGYMFAHGGASLQEIIIPVIISEKGKNNSKETVNVMLLNSKLSITASRLRFTLLQVESIDQNKKARTISIALYYNNQPVSSITEITLDKTSPLPEDRKYTIDLTLNTHVDSRILQLKVHDIESPLNPLITENVTNNTLIEQDF